MTYRAITAPAPEAMSIWTITASPSDHAGKHVIRRHEIGADGQPGPTDEHHVCDTLDQARGFVPPGLVCFERDPSDDAVIVESWL